MGIKHTLSSSCRFMRMEDGNAHECVCNCKVLDEFYMRTFLLSFYIVRNKLLNDELSEIKIIAFKNVIFHLYLLSHTLF